MFPLNKYKYFTNNTDLVIAEQTYAGKKYRGKARLGTGDTFDLDTGKELAAARCDKIICKKRCDSAFNKVMLYNELYEAIKKDLISAKEFFDDSQEEYYNSIKRLEELNKKVGLN